MARAVLKVEQAGPLTTIQDAGRMGHLRYGVTRSGPIDRIGFAAAHAVLGNMPGGAAIELSHGGMAMRCVEGAVGFALAGGDFAATVDGLPLGDWTTGVLRAGSRLVIRDGMVGNWATLAFAGRIDCPRWLGSAATLALAGLGGGRLCPGDIVVVDDAVGDGEPRAFGAPVAVSGPLRVVAGPQAGWFAEDAMATLCAAAFAATAAFDRMGMVIAGPPLLPRSLSMLSAPLLRGAIQINGAGAATILLADHQTTAGYPRLATVIGVDLDRAAQARPGEVLRFEAIEVAAAIGLARAAAVAERNYLAGLVAVAGSLGERLLGANLIDGVVDARD